MSGSVVVGDTRAEALPLIDGSVQTTVTSPPYWGQRDYGYADQSGIEQTYTEYLDWWRSVCAEVHRVTAASGTWWLNVGDTYNTRATIRPSAHQGGVGHDNESIRMTWADHRDRGLVRYSARQPGFKDKDLMGLPWLMASIAQEVGWWLRCDVIWAKPYGMSENAPDRPARSHEYVFLFAKSRQGVKSRRTPYMNEHRSVWPIAPRHGAAGPASFPEELVQRCLEGTTDPGDLVLDPFGGAGTTAVVAERMSRRAVAFDAAPADLLTAWWNRAYGTADESMEATA